MVSGDYRVLIKKKVGTVGGMSQEWTTRLKRTDKMSVLSRRTGVVAGPLSQDHPDTGARAWSDYDFERGPTCGTGSRGLPKMKVGKRSHGRSSGKRKESLAPCIKINL